MKSPQPTQTPQTTLSKDKAGLPLSGIPRITKKTEQIPKLESGTFNHTEISKIVSAISDANNL